MLKRIRRKIRAEMLRRRTVRELSQLDDRSLRDIGVSRYDFMSRIDENA